jgi:hypothetical protein
MWAEKQRTLLIQIGDHLVNPSFIAWVEHTGAEGQTRTIHLACGAKDVPITIDDRQWRELATAYDLI